MDERTGSGSLKREEELDRKFLTSGQEKVKLEIALMRYFELAKDKNKDFLSEMEQTYQNYLLKRFRPAMDTLLEQKENKKMRQLFLQKKMSQGLLEELLLMASKAHNTEAFLWLLEQKQALYGFEKGDMEL